MCGRAAVSIGADRVMVLQSRDYRAARARQSRTGHRLRGGRDEGRGDGDNDNDVVSVVRRPVVEISDRRDSCDSVSSRTSDERVLSSETRVRLFGTPAPDCPPSFYGASEWLNEEKHQDNLNAPPTSYLPVLRHSSEQRPPVASDAAPSRSSVRVIESMRFGVHVDSLGKLVVNARSDSVVQSRMWSRLLPHNRGVLLANGYFEWKQLKDSPKKRQAYFIKFADNDLIHVACLFRRAKPAKSSSHFDDDETVSNENEFAPITVDAAPSIGHIHERMPVLLRTREELDKWLDPSTSLVELMRLLRPYDGPLEQRPVGSAVNKVNEKSTRVVERIDPNAEPKNSIKNFFSPVKPTPKSSTRKETQKETTTPSAVTAAAAPLATLKRRSRMTTTEPKARGATTTTVVIDSDSDSNSNSDDDDDDDDDVIVIATTIVASNKKRRVE